MVEKATLYPLVPNHFPLFPRPLNNEINFHIRHSSLANLNLTMNTSLHHLSPPHHTSQGLRLKSQYFPSPSNAIPLHILQKPIYKSTAKTQSLHKSLRPTSERHVSISVNSRAAVAQNIRCHIPHSQKQQSSPFTPLYSYPPSLAFAGSTI